MIKAFHELGTEETTSYNNILKWQTHNIILHSNRLKAFPLRTKTSQRSPLLPLLFNVLLKVVPRAIWQGKNKKNSKWKGRSKIISVHRWSFFFFFPALGRYSWYINSKYIFSKYTTQWFNICIHWERISAFILLLLLSCLSRVRLCATPERAAHQAPPSLGFSRQEHWSGLPFPSPTTLLANFNYRLHHYQL